MLYVPSTNSSILFSTRTDYESKRRRIRRTMSLLIPISIMQLASHKHSFSSAYGQRTAWYSIPSFLCSAQYWWCSVTGHCGMRWLKEIRGSNSWNIIFQFLSYKLVWKKHFHLFFDNLITFQTVRFMSENDRMFDAWNTRHRSRIRGRI